MHFLDNVFPLQYPMYHSGIERGGRGWLLGMLLRTKHLYHAAITFSAYHRRTSVLTEVSQSDQVNIVIFQEKHLEICLQLVSELAQTTSLKLGQGFVTTVTQLIFFEVRIPLSDCQINTNAI
jgi:C6 transcription factor Pro1